MSDPRPPVILSAPNRNFRVRGHFNSATFEDDQVRLGEGQELPLVWEITLPELVELASLSTNCSAVIDGWRGNQKVAQIKLAYADDYDSFEMTFIAQSDFTSLRVLSLSTPTAAVVIRSATERRVVLIDRATNRVLGGDDGLNDLDVVIFPYRQVRSGMEGIRDGLEALADGPGLVFRETVEDCKTERKIGWVMVVAGTVLAGLSFPVAAPAAAVVAGAVAIGALGGAGAAKVDHDARECTEKAKERDDPDSEPGGEEPEPDDDG